MLHFLLLPRGDVVISESFFAPVPRGYFLLDEVGTFGWLTLLVPSVSEPVTPAMVLLLVIAVHHGLPSFFLDLVLEGPVDVFQATFVICVLDVACF